MRFLIDRCAGRRIAAWLSSLGHDVLESRSLGPDPGDLALAQLAFRQRRVLITIDTDFGNLVFVDKVPLYGLVRLPDVPSSRRIALMKHVLEHHSHDLEEGAMLTIKGDRIRISRPPTH